MVSRHLTLSLSPLIALLRRGSCIKMPTKLHLLTYNCKNATHNENLLPQALLVYDPEVARREFQVLAKLVQQVDCYRLHFGRDILELPKLITPLLENGR
jgi:hypothetical protein